jgi:hypothetical protein
MSIVFDPSRDDVRRFFCDTWQKDRSGQVLTPLEAIALGLVRAHPEYHALLQDRARALDEHYTVERGETNPFLHLSMHLALEEQLGIDQPPGVRAAFEAIAARAGDLHAAAHEAMECLGEVLWQTQRGTLPPEIGAINNAYLECLRRRAG